MGEAFSSGVHHVPHDWPTGAEEQEKKNIKPHTITSYNIRRVQEANMQMKVKQITKFERRLEPVLCSGTDQWSKPVGALKNC